MLHNFSPSDFFAETSLNKHKIQELTHKVNELEDKLQEIEIIQANQAGRDKVIGVIIGALVAALIQVWIAPLLTPQIPSAKPHEQTTAFNLPSNPLLMDDR